MGPAVVSRVHQRAQRVERDHQSAFISSTPGPYALAVLDRKGISASVPLGKTVSICPISKTGGSGWRTPHSAAREFPALSMEMMLDGTSQFARRSEIVRAI